MNENIFTILQLIVKQSIVYLKFCSWSDFIPTSTALFKSMYLKSLCQHTTSSINGPTRVKFLLLCLYQTMIQRVFRKQKTQFLNM